MILQVIGAILGVIGGSIVLKAPKRTLAFAGILGGLGWVIYLLANQVASALVATFITGVAITLMSHLWARWTKSPVTIFLIPGFLTLVPGVALYASVAAFIQGSPLAADHLRTTFTISGLIALSIFIVDSLLKSFDSK